MYQVLFWCIEQHQSTSYSGMEPSILPVWRISGRGRKSRGRERVGSANGFVLIQESASHPCGVCFQVLRDGPSENEDVTLHDPSYQIVFISAQTCSRMPHLQKFLRGPRADHTKPVRQRQISHDIPYMWNPKK